MWLSLALAGCVVEKTQPAGPPPAWVPPADAPEEQGPVVDSIVQSGFGSVDFLIAVDPALAPAVEAALPDMVERLLDTPVVWRVGFVSSALGDPAAAGILAGPLLTDAGGEVPVDALSDVGPYGALDALCLALQPGANGSFPSAEQVHLVIVTAAHDEAANTPECAEFLDGTWPDAAVSVIAPQDDPLLASVADTVLSDVSDPLDTAFADIGLAATGLRREFFLTEQPRIDTLSVEVAIYGGVSSFGPEDWIYHPSRNSIEFMVYIPPMGSVIELTYEPVE